MAALKFSDRAATARLAADRARRFAYARAMRSRLLRWQFGPPIADELLLVPRELRTADPSFADEHAQGLFGLGGAVAHIGSGSVFDLPAPSKAWTRELHGFGWLRHLRASGAAISRTQARSAVIEWIAKFANTQHPDVWASDVIGRRIMSWIANADMLLEDATPADYDTITDSLGSQLIRLSASWPDSPPGYPRLCSLMALMTGALCIAGHDRLADKYLPQLEAALQRQLLDDGGHVTRNPAIVVEILLDLLPLRTCFLARHRPIPTSIEAAIVRMLRFIRFIRLGDGSLGRFNGMGATPFDSLATLLGYDPAPDAPLGQATASDYVKMEARDITLLADVGNPPPLLYAAHAGAGALSFEMSVGTQALFVNGGAPGPADLDWLAASRATSSHNTLTLAARSSAQLIRGKLLERLIGGPPVRHPHHVNGQLSHDDDATILEAEHDGFGPEFGLIHKRRLSLKSDGSGLDGQEAIVSGRTAAVRLPRDIPYAVHFHVHPDVVCRQSEDPALATLQLPDGQLWYFRSEKATISIEDSIHFADLVGPRNAHQIVLRGSCFGEATVRWSLSKLADVT